MARKNTKSKYPIRIEQSIPKSQSKPTLTQQLPLPTIRSFEASIYILKYCSEIKHIKRSLNKYHASRRQDLTSFSKLRGIAIETFQGLFSTLGPPFEVVRSRLCGPSLGGAIKASGAWDRTKEAED